MSALAPFTTPSLVTYESHGIQPPSPLHIKTDDDILVKIFAPTIGLPFSVNVEFRLLTPEGEIKPSRTVILVNASTVTQRFNLGECFILSAGASLANSTAKRGQVFLQCFVVRNITADVLTLWTLLSEYLTTNFRPSWPNGQIATPQEGFGNLRSITGTVPGVGNDISETVPTGVRWKLIALSGILTTSATVANRNVSCQLDDGVNTYFTSPSYFSETANSTFGYTLQQLSNSATITGGNIPLQIPPEIVLSAGHRIRTRTQGLQAGDQFSAPQYLVEEWVDI